MSCCAVAMRNPCHQIDGFSDFSRESARSDLHKQLFLKTCSSMGRAVQERTMTIMQRRHKKVIPVGMKASLTTAWCIYASDWGRHPVAQESYVIGIDEKGKQLRVHANNLLLLESDAYWHGKEIEHMGKIYKAFSLWGDFAKHLTEMLQWSNTYTRIMQLPSWSDQLKQISLLDENPDQFYATLWRIVRNFGLEDIDLA